MQLIIAKTGENQVVTGAAKQCIAAVITAKQIIPIKSVKDVVLIIGAADFIAEIIAGSATGAAAQD